MIPIFLKNGMIVLGIILILILIVSFLNFYLATHPGKWPMEFTPESFGLPYENVHFTTADGLRLNGWFLPSEKSNNTIIVMHGYPTNKADVLPFSLFLLKKYNVLLFDFRSFGRSEGSYTTAGYKEVKDLDAAITYLKTRGDSGGIAVLGFSLGGAVALMNDNKEIKAIVSDSSYANLNNMIHSMYRPFFAFRYPFVFATRPYGKIFFGIDPKLVSPEASITKGNRPIFLIHGKKDTQIPVAEAYKLHAANKNAQLWIVEDADHGHAYALHKKKYENKVFEFFETHLK